MAYLITKFFGLLEFRRAERPGYGSFFIGMLAGLLLVQSSARPTAREVELSIDCCRDHRNQKFSWRKNGALDQTEILLDWLEICSNNLREADRINLGLVNKRIFYQRKNSYC